MPHSEREHTPVLPGARQLSEDDSDEESLHRIIREETERRAGGLPREAEEGGERTDPGSGEA